MSRSNELFELAQKVIPGGVNSPVRAFNGVGGTPPFIQSAKGAYIFDEDGKQYIDYVGSWGPMLLGHNHPAIIDAVNSAVNKGLSFGAPTAIEIKMAEKVCQLMPSIDMVRMVSSGTEATMSAIRLARGFTGRNKLVKFEGCYHGHADSLLVKAGSGALTLGEPTSPGVPADFAQHTLVADFNDIESVRTLFAQHPEDIACVIVEPVAGNMNCVPPKEDFLQQLHAVCQSHDSLLIFDEVMTGFRVAPGGAQEMYGVKPDLTTLGKVIGGGMPVGAFGGRRDVMEKLAPLGPVYQAGTLSGNPVAMAAGLAALSEIEKPAVFGQAVAATQALVKGIEAEAKRHGIPLCTQHAGAMFGIFFTEESSIHSFRQVSACNIDRFKAFYHLMLTQGVYLAPSAYEAGFVSTAHSEQDIDNTVRAAGAAFAKL